MVKRAKTIKVKGPSQKLISPAEFAKALGAEETNIKINTKQDPISLFILPPGLMNNESVRLAVDITERLFGEAPLHLKRPQAVELSKLTLGQLQVIARIKRFPIPKRTRDKIVSALESEELVKRMEKRWRMASSVISAEKEGLYEAAEHATGMLDLSDEAENPPKPSLELKKAMRLRETRLAKHSTTVHPGEVLKEEFLNPMGIAVYRIAKETGLSRTQLGQIIKEERGITAETARKIGKFLKTGPEFWMNLQELYDIDVTREQTPADVYDAVHTAGGSGHGKRVATGKAILKKQLAAKRKKWK
jgi:addiction module HigA family antidote